MLGKSEHIPLVSVDKALKLKHYMTIGEMYTVKELSDAYRKRFGYDREPLWDTLSLLSFVYEIGRIQGMREVRRK